MRTGDGKYRDEKIGDGNPDGENPRSESPGGKNSGGETHGIGKPPEGVQSRRMRFGDITNAVKGEAVRKKGLFAGVGAALAAETVTALCMPQLLSRILDQLTVQSNAWLYGAAAAYCGVVLLKGAVSVFNTYLSEKLGWGLCDCLRADLFRVVYDLRMEQHGRVRAGEFLERLEGDVNILAGFFSSMFIDILGSVLLVAGILFVFWQKSGVLGGIFTVLSAGILMLFVTTQKGIARLWEAARAGETEVLGEFSQAVEAERDIAGLQKGAYVLDRFEHRYARFGKRQVRASFLGNLPATAFFSLLNLGEGTVLAVGVFLMGQGRMSLGELYLILSYAGILNFPFYRLKNEFAQLPAALAAAERIGGIYGMREPPQETGTEKVPADGSIVFQNGSFCYEPEQEVLKNVSFSVRSGEKVLIEGRTGGGKSTILSLIAGLYAETAGSVLVGGHAVSAYSREAYGRIVYCIFQSNPILNDTLRSNLTRYGGGYDDAAILEAVSAVGLEDWMRESGRGLDSVISGEDVTRDEAQRIAWAGALLAKPAILLADEFDAVIREDTVRLIDGLIGSFFADTTVLFVSHRKRSAVQVQKRLLVEEGEVFAVPVRQNASESGE